MKELFMKYKEVISYLFFGVLTTVVNFVVYFACTDGLHINYREMAVFVGCRVFSGVMDMGIMFISVDMIGISDRIAKFVTQVAVVVLNYIFSKIIIFRNK